MAKVKITGHASGTGILTVTAPNTSTDRTITLPDSTGTILDENSSLPAANLTGSVPSAALGNVDLSKLEYNQAILAFKIASSNQLAKFQMVDQVIDEYQDATGIDAGNSTNALASGSGTAKYYEGGATVTPSIAEDADDTGTDGDYSWYKWTDTAATGSYQNDTSQDTDFLVIAGGGGGGYGEGGAGGGAGGFKYYSQKTGVGTGSHTVTIGAGGAGKTGSGGTGVNGSDSSFGALTATGGGGGGSFNVAGAVGGSGGGGGGRNGTAGGAGTSNQGNTGGGATPGTGSTDDSGGGGGGASAVGATAANQAGANGGAGYTEGTSTVYDWTLANGTTATFDIDGVGGAFAGGGAGGSEYGSGGTGTHGGGNADAVGSANTGGGGGGNDGGGGSGFLGGSGVVIVRRLTTVTTLGANLTLQSTATTAESAPTTADLVVLIEDGAGTATVNTDIKGYVSRDGSAFSSEVTFVDEGDWGTNKRILVARNIDISGITSGVAMKYKLTTHNQSASSKETRIHATSLAWA